MISTLVLLSPATSAPAMQSENYLQRECVVDSAGNSYAGAGSRLYDCVGEALSGQSWGRNYSVQAGFFNDYYLPPPTPTITCTPIRSFGGEILSPEYVFAAPNPILGKQGYIHFDLAVPAEVWLHIYTPTNRLVISRHWDSLPAGTNQWVWETANLANGVYLLLIRGRGPDGKETRVVKKLALIK